MALENILEGARNFLKENKTFLVSAGLILSGNLGDAMSTNYEISKGLATEANPIMAVIIKEFGTEGFYAAKMGLATVGTALLAFTRTKNEKLSVTGAKALAAIYSGICMYHDVSFNFPQLIKEYHNLPLVFT